LIRRQAEILLFQRPQGGFVQSVKWLQAKSLDTMQDNCPWICFAHWDAKQATDSNRSSRSCGLEAGHYKKMLAERAGIGT
jgi:hypothetical protein